MTPDARASRQSVKSGKPVVAYVATREPDYSRVAITLQAVEDHAEVILFVSTFRSYPLRIVSVLWRFLLARITGQLRRVDVVFVGFFAQPILPVIRCLWRGKLISDGYFSLYDTYVNDKRKASPGSMRARMCFWLDRFMLKQSDLVLTDTCEHVDYFRRQFELPEARIERVWISAITEKFTPLPHLPVVAGEPFRVCFWGGFIPLQGVDVIVRAAAMLKEHPIELVIAGDGQTLAECEQLARQLECSNLTFSGWQKSAAIRELVARSHLVLGIFGTTEKAARVIPNKAFEAIALRRPLVTGDSAASRELFQNQHNAMLVPLGDPEGLAAQILDAFEHPEELQRIAEAGYATFCDVASPECVSELMGQHLRGIVAPSRIETSEAAAL